jgi:hypothetical protein
MATQKSMLSEFGWDQRYYVSSIEDVLTPALLMYPNIISSNIERTLKLLAGDAERWRVHIKTAKLSHTMRMLVEREVRNFKSATILELLVAARRGPRYRRVCRNACRYPCIGGGYDSPDRKQCEQRVFERSQFNSMIPPEAGTRIIRKSC